jgi:hypothetical protein
MMPWVKTCTRRAPVRRLQQELRILMTVERQF